MATRPLRFPPGSVVPAGLYRSAGSGRVRFFDGGTPLPGSVNSSSWQPVADRFPLVAPRSAPAPHLTVPEASTHRVRFAAGSMVSAGEYRNSSSGAVRYFDGATPLPGGVNSTSWQQVSDHYHAHRERSEHDRRPLITFPVSSGPAREAIAAPASAVAVAVTATAVSAPSAPATAGELAVELINRVNLGDATAVAELFAADAHLFLPLGPLLVCHRGPRHVRRALAWLRANLHSHTMSVERISGGETGVTIDFDTRGRSVDGVDFDRPGAMIVEAAGGSIRLVHVYLGPARA